MVVNVLHHGRCFDGAASSALFAAFYREVVNREAEFNFIPKHHRRGDPFVDSDFAAPEVAIVDFRYSQRKGLTWYFDHHRSAFQLPGDREHFEADTSGQKFHDPDSPSCAQYLTEITRQIFGFAPAGFDELLEWATRIDSASFESPSVPVGMNDPALELAAFIQGADDLYSIRRFINDLGREELCDIAKKDYIRAVVDPRIQAHRADTDLVGRVAQEDKGVLEYNLLPFGPRILNHFIPYFHFPKVSYVVGMYSHHDGDLRLSVGYNPWLPADGRKADLAELCEQHGGGGHPHVAGCSFALDEEDRLTRAYKNILTTLRKSG